MQMFDLLLKLQETNPVVHQEINGKSWTACDILDQVWPRVHALTARNVVAGNAVILFVDDTFKYICTFWALTAVGAKIIPLLKGDDNHQLNRVLSRHAIDHIITDEVLADVGTVPVYNVAELDSGIKDPVAVYQYLENDTYVCYPTSGTSGGFKLISHTNISVNSSVNTLLELTQFFKDNKGHRGDMLFCPAKFAFGVGSWFNVLGPVALGYVSLIGFKSSNMRDILSILDKYQVKYLTVMPHFLEFMNNHVDGCLPPSVQAITSAGDFLLSPTAYNFKNKFNIDIFNLYGMTEYGCIAYGPYVSSSMAGKILTINNMKVRIVDDDGNECGINQSGIIQVLGPCVFKEYLDDVSATNHVVRDGWIHTNDIGQITDSGELMLFGRRNSYFKLRGKWISAIDIENKVLKATHVTDCVVTYADGSLLIKLVVPDLSMQLQVKTLILDKFKRSFRSLNIEFIDEVPRTLTMKKLRPHKYE